MIYKGSCLPLWFTCGTPSTQTLCNEVTCPESQGERGHKPDLTSRGGWLLHFIFLFFCYFHLGCRLLWHTAYLLLLHPHTLHPHTLPLDQQAFWAFAPLVCLKVHKKPVCARAPIQQLIEHANNRKCAIKATFTWSETRLREKRFPAPLLTRDLQTCCAPSALFCKKGRPITGP